MRILIIDTYYEDFLDKFYQTKKHLKKSSYDDQLKALIDASFGTSDYYSYYLNSYKKFKASDLIVNCKYLQNAWAKENNIKVFRINLNYKLFKIPIFGDFLNKLPNLADIAYEQIKKIKPDIIYIQNLSFFPKEVLLNIKTYSKLVVGQIASPLPPLSFLEPYDLILTSFPHFVDQIRKIGINSEYFKIGFDSRVLKRLIHQKKDISFSFVGSISKYHNKAMPLIEYLIKKNSLKIFGQGVKNLPIFSKTRRYHSGEKWGLEMYSILQRSLISLNRHISTSKNYANNMRLFEATGMGSLLLTDYKDNLNEMFVIDKEVITYKSKEEASDKASYYLRNQDQLKKIALAGQKRTLKDHTYEKRMGELNIILKKYL